MVKASEGFVRIIVRRPHAYEIKRTHKDAPIPGLAILDAEGAFVGKHDFKGDKPVEAILELLKKHR